MWSRHLAGADQPDGPVPPDRRGGYQEWPASDRLEFTADAYRTVLYTTAPDNRCGCPAAAPTPLAGLTSHRAVADHLRAAPRVWLVRTGESIPGRRPGAVRGRRRHPPR